jgi:2-iminobutanoate/2-iminopropanoate deaminase
MNDRTPVLVSSAPQPIGPYSQAIKCGNTVYVSGQIALDLNTGQLVSPDVAAQTRQVLEYLREILEAVDVGGFGRIAKTTIYLTDMADFPTVNKVYAEYFPVEAPARATVQVAALPRGAKIEIDAVAVFPSPAPVKESGGMML